MLASQLISVESPALPVTRHARGWARKLFLAGFAAAFFGVGAHEASAQITRLLGLDVSCWQGSISQTVWNNLCTNDNRRFVIIRSSRGGTTGEDHRSCGYPGGDNTYTNLSQRYDDPYFVQNITYATAAGMFAGMYHFSRPDIIATTGNSGGIPNNGTDEADHFIQMAGAWMRPGYLPPMFDFEAGINIRTDDELAQFCIDFSNRIYERLGIRPSMYINGNYAANILQTASAALRDQIAKPPPNLPTNMVPSVVSPAYPYLVSARWPNQADPGAIDVQNGEPIDSYAPIYGPWDDYGVTNPWKFWQYASTMKLPSYSTTANLDVDVVRGGWEFLKDQLIPAVWLNDSSGDWSTQTNWNSGQTAVAPATGPNQIPPTATGPFPTARLPGGAAPNMTDGTNDTVILERPAANITVTLSTGTHNIRKLYMREALNITGGSLTVNYVPSADSTTFGAQFSGPVTLGGSGSLSVHTLQVDPAQTFTLSGGTLTFNTINLMPHSTTPATNLVSGDVNWNPLANAAGSVTNGSGTGNSGVIDLDGGTRTLTVGDGTAEVDVAIGVPIANGALSKAGAGTMRLSAASTYSGGTTVSAGRLLVNNTGGSGTGSGGVTVSGGVLGGTGTIAGVVTVNSGGTVAPGTASAIGTLTFNSVPALGGTNYMRINRNGGTPLADTLVLSSGTLNYGGRLVVANIGAALVDGDVFTLFTAGAYTGAFAAVELPALGDGLSWDLGSLTVNGTLKVISLNAPVISSGPNSLTVGVGQNATFSVSAGGAQPLSYQWRYNGSDLGGATLSSYTKLDVQPADAGSYTVVVTNTYGSVTSATATLTVIVPPTIDTQPLSQTITQGNTATFTVAASGTTPLSYQWRFNTVPISGATTYSYAVADAQPASAGSYSVVVTNAAGSATSASAVLTVISPPVITTQPQSQTVVAGQDASFTVTATGATPLAYQWSFNGTNLAGATLSAYTRPAVQPADAGSYAVVVTNLYGTANSSNAVLAVNFLLTTAAIAGGTVSNSPDQPSYAPNAVVSLTANANTDYAFIGWSGDATGTNNPLSVTMTTNKSISATFVSTATDIILDNTNSAVTFVGTWQSGTSAPDKYGPDYRFASTATGGTSNAVFRPYIYTPGYYDVFIWYSVGSNRATNAPWSVVYDGGSLNIPVNQQVNGGTWVLLGAALPFVQGTNGYVVLSNNTGYAGSVVMADAVRFTLVTNRTLTITTVGGGTVYKNPDLSGYAHNSVVTLIAAPVLGWNFNNWSGSASGTANPLTLTLTQSLSVTGSFTSAVSDLIVDNPQAPKTGTWTLRTTSGSGYYGANYETANSVVTSPNATATFTPTIVTAGNYDIYIWYPSGSGTLSATAPFLVSYSGGTTNITVNQQANQQTWRPLASGLKFAAGTSGFVRLSNNTGVSGQRVMADAVRWVYSANQDSPPVIIAQPESQTANAGGSATFSASAAGTAPLSYQWRQNGTNIPGATASSYTRGNLQSGDAGTYVLVVINAAGSVTSSNALLTVNTMPVATTTVVSDDKSGASAYGDLVTFTATVTGNSPSGTVQFKNGGNDLGSPISLGAGQAQLPISTLGAAGHSISAVYSGDSNNYGSTSAPHAFAVSPRPATLSGTRPYDATATASYLILSIGNKVGSDVVNVVSGAATLASAHVGSRSITSPNTLALGGAQSANYTLAGAVGSVTITKTNLTVTAAANTKVYDGTTSAAATPTITAGALQGSDTPSFTETYDTKDAGTGKTLTPAGTVNDNNGGNNYNYTFVPAANGTITTATTAGSLVCSPNPSLPGSDVTFTATVTNLVAGGPLPAGDVQFKTNGVLLSAPVPLDGSGLAGLVTNSLAHGSNTVFAEFAGDGNFLGMTNSVVQVVNTPPTSSNSTAGTPQNQPLVLSTAKLLRFADDPDAGDTLSVIAAGPTSTNGPANNVVLNTGAGTITYTPAAGYRGSDLFSYTVSDNYGATVVASVFVTVTSTNLGSPNIVAGPTFSNGVLRVTFAGIPDRVYTIEYSGPLSGNPPSYSWAFLKTITADADGLFEVVDEPPPGTPSRYYRTMYYP